MESYSGHSCKLSIVSMLVDARPRTYASKQRRRFYNCCTEDTFRNLEIRHTARLSSTVIDVNTGLVSSFIRALTWLPAGDWEVSHLCG